MYRLLISLIVCLLTVGIVYAQEGGDGVWQSASDGGVEYNCDVLSSVLAAIDEGNASTVSRFGEDAIARNGEDVVTSVYEYVGNEFIVLLMPDSNAAITVDDIFSEAIDACSEEAGTSSVSNAETFNVVVNGDVNLRSCAGTDCDIVRQANDGELLTVVGEDGDWYEVQLDDGTAFIANWLTTRGPDDLIRVDEPYFDARTGCVVAFDIKRGDMDINLILTGTNRNDVLVDLYRPNETTPLRVEGQLDKTFIDTGDPYVHQYYSFGLFWPLGLYQLEITMNGETSNLAWELEERGDYNIFVLCDA